ncbi:arsenic metallochaperone ArsD family protein [Enterococcus faecalis]|uniref:arsenic metallochaperone ArsD family protein n=1 Tax=Enterococcus faecalis TaxID=1351 RepID=UPI000314BD75|nr:arsenic metallochaperone ArsD family protein [Enterococcus faecalis]EIA6646865.1 arsenic metallochaperone ArsD family protein [Enterococcus faecalis]EIW2105350.1 arsenic metallochaperone ArsD family protein [Enterococcus faecalis]
MQSVVLFESEMCCGRKMAGTEINRQLFYLNLTLQKIQKKKSLLEADRASKELEEIGIKIKHS